MNDRVCWTVSQLPETRSKESFRRLRRVSSRWRVEGRRVMILMRTHANRWVARKTRLRPVNGVITRVSGPAHGVVYKTFVPTRVPTERILLRDADSLEVAFALLLAHLARRGTISSPCAPE